MEESPNVITPDRDQVKNPTVKNMLEESGYFDYGEMRQQRLESLNAFEKKQLDRLVEEHGILYEELREESVRLKKLAEKQNINLPEDYLGNKAGVSSNKMRKIIKKMKANEKIREKKFNEDWMGNTPEENAAMYEIDVEDLEPTPSYAELFDPHNVNSPHYVPIVFDPDKK